MPKITYDGNIKIVDYGDWQERIFLTDWFPTRENIRNLSKTIFTAIIIHAQLGYVITGLQKSWLN